MEDYNWLNKESRIFLERGYLEKGQSPEERLQEIADCAEKILKIDGFSDKFLGYLKKGYYSLSTPVWCNFGTEKGLGVSCFGSYVGDSMTDILSTCSEIGMMSKMGGGTSIYVGDLRARGSEIKAGGKSGGPVHFLEIFDKITDVVSQGASRRGSVASYLPVEHPDILDYLKINSKNHTLNDFNFAVTVTDKWMNEMLGGDRKKGEVWMKIIKKRFETGYPYVTFIDTCNDNAPDVYKEKDIKIKAQNLCAEICLSSDIDNSFVCVLSSINLLHWDEIKDTDAVETLTYFLDAVNEEFVAKTKDIPYMEKAHNFAKSQRALGMGVLGWHSYLQSKMIPFESFDAQTENISIFKSLKEKAYKASKDLSFKLGEPSMLKGKGRRNMTLLAVAPTTSSSFILGQISQGIEPVNSNYFVKKLAKGNFTCKNPFLEELLKRKDKNTPEVWKSILTHGGSVLHLDFLSDNEKKVFATFGEISQKEIVIQASQRQKYIDQGQSLNLMVPPKTNWVDVGLLMVEGWKMGVKSFYYQRSANPAQELARNIMNCVSCE